jgi:hypothetical protein
MEAGSRNTPKISSLDSGWAWCEPWLASNFSCADGWNYPCFFVRGEVFDVSSGKTHYGKVAIHADVFFFFLADHAVLNSLELNPFVPLSLASSSSLIGNRIQRLCRT